VYIARQGVDELLRTENEQVEVLQLHVCLG
jgi:hypothetical protein